VISITAYVGQQCQEQDVLLYFIYFLSYSVLHYETSERILCMDERPSKKTAFIIKQWYDFYILYFKTWS